MRKIYIFFTLITLLISCSNNNLQKGFSLKQKKELIIFISSIKENLNKNNIKYIKENVEKNFKNNYILKNINEIYFPAFNIFVSEPTFIEEKNVGTSILGLNLKEETTYFKLYFIYDLKEKKWKIKNIDDAL